MIFCSLVDFFPLPLRVSAISKYTASAEQARVCKSSPVFQVFASLSGERGGAEGIQSGGPSLVGVLVTPAKAPLAERPKGAQGLCGVVGWRDPGWRARERASR